MSEKVLSQDEISALLNAVGSEEKGHTGQKAFPSPQRPPREMGPGGEEGYIFPMAKAQELSRELESALLLVFDGFAHKGSATFSHTFRTQVGFKIHEIEQIFYGDFIESLPEPSSIWYLEVKPQNLHIAVCLEPNLVSSIVSLMLGGSSIGQIRGRSVITDLEQSIVENAVTVFCRELRHAWSRITDVEFTIDNRETRPRLLRIYPPNETMVVIGMSMKMGVTEGTIYWGLPSGLLKSLHDAFSHQRQAESREKLAETVTCLRETSGRFSTRIEACLSTTRVPVSELLELGEGDVLKLEHLVGDPAGILINDCPLFGGEIVLSNDRKAIRIA